MLSPAGIGKTLYWAGRLSIALLKVTQAGNRRCRSGFRKGRHPAGDHSPRGRNKPFLGSTPVAAAFPSRGAVRGDTPWKWCLAARIHGTEAGVASTFRLGDRHVEAVNLDCGWFAFGT